MAFKALVSIGDYDLPTPSSYVGTTETIVDGERNTAGIMIGQEVRADLGRVDAEYSYIDSATWAAILQKFSSTYGGSFTRDVTFWDQVANDWVTKNMYVGNRTTSGVLRVDPDTGRPIGYSGAKLNLIEV